MNVTVTRKGAKTGTVVRNDESVHKDALTAHYTIAFDALPGQTFGPYGFAETWRDLTVSADLSNVDARNLVLDAWTDGSATRAAGRPGW